MKGDHLSNDKAEFAVVESAMSKLGIDGAERMNLYQVVAAVLHLGNIKFEDSGDSKGWNKYYLTCIVSFFVYLG